MCEKKPQFAVGQAVREKFSFANAILDRGVVIKTYEVDDQYCYVIKFETGREEVFFEKELVADRNARN